MFTFHVSSFCRKCVCTHVMHLIHTQLFRSRSELSLSFEHRCACFSFRRVCRMALRRIQKEPQDGSRTHPPNCSAALAGDVMCTWQTIISGSQDSPYKGCVFFLNDVLLFHDQVPPQRGFERRHLSGHFERCGVLHSRIPRRSCLFPHHGQIRARVTLFVLKIAAR